MDKTTMGHLHIRNTIKRLNKKNKNEKLVYLGQKEESGRGTQTESVVATERPVKRFQTTACKGIEITK